MIKCNNLDLNLFQFDYDLTFGVLFINADKTIYARYGTRTGHDADKDVAINGLAETMKAVLEIHEHYPANKKLLSAKQPQQIAEDIPEDYPSLSHFSPTLNYQGQVSKSCIHCHQLRDAARLVFRKAGKPMPEKLLFPFPSASVLGLKFDKNSRATVSEVTKDSAASRAGILVADEIHLVNGQSISSEADLYWMLHHQGSDAVVLKLEIVRSGDTRSLEMELPKDWRKLADISWRPTSWDLRRMSTGGLLLLPLSNDKKRELGISDDAMALIADHVGQYGNHAGAKRAGIRKNDVIISFDGQRNLMSENAVIEYAVQQKRAGDRVTIEYIRNGEKKSASFKLQ